MDNKCIICGEGADVKSSFGYDRHDEIRCSKCGHYVVSEEISNCITYKIRSAMYFYMKNRQQKNIPFFSDDRSKLLVLNDNGEYVDKAMLDNLYPRNFAERIDKIMLNLNTVITFIGKSFDFIDVISGVYYEKFKKEIEFASILFYIDDTLITESDSLKGRWEQLKGIVEVLKEIDYFKVKQFRPEHKQNSSAENMISFSFTAKGWEYLQTLQKDNDVIPQCFVAMSFSDDMKPVREAIRKGIELSGYNAVIMDEIQHNKQIIPEMLYQIRQSKFVVAELTEHNNGAYYEAGYAAGVGKEVIHICKEATFKKDGHFDVKQIATILWETVDDLTDKLQKRIEATVGKNG
ncbi:hypothetical protein FACS1894105_00900 [Clostridia bacterium]|nr:hypothetical protein FACS1894105_00900 [Clostridia bacterium]